ncbi:MAG TPA: hypothetical protein PKO12_07620 [Holophaga sp.]|nr:hypothetical protein [Holophaga sp.]
MSSSVDYLSLYHAVRDRILQMGSGTVLSHRALLDLAMACTNAISRTQYSDLVGALLNAMVIVRRGHGFEVCATNPATSFTPQPKRTSTEDRLARVEEELKALKAMLGHLLVASN